MTYHARAFHSRAAVSASPSLSAMADAARRTPILAASEEADLARRYRDSRDVAALDRLVRAHTRLVLKRAKSYAGYGLSMEDLVSEGHVGLVKSLESFDPERGFRVSTYAGWWIDAMLKTYVITNWSLVKVGTTAEQKRLFFGLRRAKARLAAYSDGEMTADDVARIAKDMEVSEREVRDMDRRLSGDRSLNVQLGADGEGAEWLDLLPDDRPSVESTLAEQDEGAKLRAVLHDALGALKDRELDIFRRRRLEEEPRTLEELANDYGVSRERIRQIEVRAMQKVTLAASQIAQSRGLASTVH